MVVNKELYERYKKLKAEGINISLSELKQQMENEIQNKIIAPPNNINPVIENQVRQNIQNFAGDYHSPEEIPSTQPNSNPTPIQASNTINTEPQTQAFSAYMQQPAQPAQQTLFQNAQEQFSAANEKPVQPQTTAAPQNNTNSWSTTYSNSSVDKNSEIYKNYSNSFNADFSNSSYGFNTNSAGLVNRSLESYSQAASAQIPFQNSNSSPAAGERKYTGNVSEEKIQAANAISKISNKYCLIGYPLGHSLSSYIHEAGFKSLGINAVYDILETPPDTLVERVKYLKNNGFAGFNVTIPLKLPITLFLDKIDTSADVVGAVNTVVINPDKTMTGYNTDVIGFKNAIPSDIILAGKTAGVLGTGGAARAAITVLAQNQVKQIKIYTRNIPNSIELLNFLRKKFPATEFNAFQIERIRDLSDVQILVNTTPIGMQGRSADMTPVEENELRTLPEGAFVYDVIYNPKKTVLIKLAQKNGYRTINGVDMFIHQAAAAEQIWTGRTPDFKDMKIAALENL